MKFTKLALSLIVLGVVQLMKTETQPIDLLSEDQKAKDHEIWLPRKKGDIIDFKFAENRTGAYQFSIIQPLPNFIQREDDMYTPPRQTARGASGTRYMKFKITSDPTYDPLLLKNAREWRDENADIYKIYFIKKLVTVNLSQPGTVNVENVKPGDIIDIVVTETPFLWGNIQYPKEKNRVPKFLDFIHHGDCESSNVNGREAEGNPETCHILYKCISEPTDEQLIISYDETGVIKGKDYKINFKKPRKGETIK